ncbi:DUF1501 domain-containing protein [soil metagenome]
MHRRTFLKTTAAAIGAPGLLSAAPPPRMGRAESCIFIWLGGGMSQIDTFDPKRKGDPSGKVWGSAYDAIDTVVPGVQVTSHLAKTARVMDRITVLRTVNHDVVDEHAAATNRVHTGRPVSGTVVYPSVGSSVAHAQGAAATGVPPYVLIGYPNLTRGPGFLGAKHSYLYLTDTTAGPAGLSRPTDITDQRQDRRNSLLDTLRRSTATRHPEATAIADYDAALQANLDLADPGFMRVFDLESERPALRQAYGSEFGQRCLLARRLVESGVRFVEVSHNLNFVNGTGWDTHNDGQRNQHLLIRELDDALSSLIIDLESKHQLDKTLIVVASEFGRPAGFDGGGGRGHWAKAFSFVLAGGGLHHLGAYGETDEKAQIPLSNPVSIPDFHATIFATLGIDPRKELYDGDRPVPLTDGGTPVAPLFL